MKQTLLFITTFLLCGALQSQTTVLDFETPGTTTTYQYFGSSIDGTVNNIIANPHASGINTSSMVAEHVKPAGAEVWAGAFPNPGLTVPVDMAANGKVCMKVWFPTAGNVGIKLENSATTGNWIRTVDVTETQTWVEVCVDASQPSIEMPIDPAAGNVFTTVTLFFNFGVSPTADVTYFWDDLVLKSTTGTDELAFDLQLFAISPTVADDFTTLNFNENLTDEKQVTVFSTTGALLETAKIASNVNTYRLQTGQLAAGIYLVYVQAGNRIATQKFVKQ